MRAVAEILNDVKFKFHPTYHVRLGWDEILVEMDYSYARPRPVTKLRMWLQIKDTALPAEFNSGRKWFLSDHMTESEVVGTAFAAYEQWLKHEMFESFEYKGVAIFNPHVSVEARVRMASDPSNFEYRS